MDAKDCRAARLEIDNSELGQRLSERLESHVAVCAACAQFRLERAELREAIEGARNTLAQSRTLITEVDAALATGRNTMLPQPNLEALPVDLRAWSKG